MMFRMSLVPPTNARHEVPAIARSELEADLDAVVDGLHDAGYDFVVGGFGQERWPVDVGYDLLLVLEQLGPVRAALSAGQPTALEFVGQGVERIVDLTPKGESVHLRCRSATDWVPSSAPDSMRASTFDAMIAELVGGVVAAAVVVRPDVDLRQWSLEVLGT